MNNSQEITAVYNYELFRFENAGGDTVIGEVTLPDGTKKKVKGPVKDEELECGQTYRFWGRPAEYKNKRTGSTEQQFAFQTFLKSMPKACQGPG